MKMADPITLVKDAVATGAATWALQSDAGKKLIGPLAEHLGLAFGQLGDVYGYYQKEMLGKIFTHWSEVRNRKPLTEDEIKRVLPLLRLASEQTNEDLHSRWASLLENIATCVDGVLPSFGQTLSQLTPEEARYLDRIWEFVMSPSPCNSGKRQSREEISYFTLKDIYNPKLRAPSPTEMRVYKDRMTPEQLAAFDEMTNFELMLHDFERLNLIGRQAEYWPGRTRYREVAGEEIPIPSDDSGMIVKYALTQYGVNFILAVRPRRPLEE
jgi:hypothetical protein